MVRGFDYTGGWRMEEREKERSRRRQEQGKVSI